MPDEAEVKVLLAQAEAARKRPSRGLWLAAIIVSLICVGALAWGLFNYWDQPAETPPSAPRARGGLSNGFGLGLMIGVAVGIAIGSALALRKQK